MPNLDGRQEDDEQLARRLQEEVEAQMWGVCSTWGDGPFMDDIPMKNADLMGFLWFSGKWHTHTYTYIYIDDNLIQKHTILNTS